MSEGPKEGQEARHTPELGAGAGGDPGSWRPDAALPGRAVDDLLAGSPDVEAKDVLAVAAELVAAPRRGRGRPPGSPNRKNKDMLDYLQALGHRDPWLTLSMIQTADTMELAKAMGTPVIVEGRPVKNLDGSIVYQPADPVKVLGIQKAAAEALMSYHHAKQPQQLDLIPPGQGYQRPLMAIGELHGNVTIGSAGQVGLSIFDAPTKTVENQAVSEADRVRHDDGVSHDTAKPLETNDNPDKSS